MDMPAKIAEYMRAAMKAGDKLKVSTLRLTLAAFTYA
jgi:uncharacterized protein YqeY